MHYITPFYLFYKSIKPDIQAISVIKQNTDTTLLSLQPLSSKWWCSGAIFNIRFPVFLKYATWTITETVSAIGTIAITKSNNGIFKYKAIAAIMPP